MKPPVTEREETLCASNFPNSKQAILRPRTVTKIDFSNFPRPKVIDELIDQDIKQQIQLLDEQYRLEGRKVSGKEAYEIKLHVRAKHQAQFIEKGIKLALWFQSERILFILRTRGLVAELDSSIINQRRIDFIANLDLQQFPEADANSPLYLGVRPLNEEDLLSDYITSTHFTKGAGPNQYFELISPGLVQEWGYPFFTSVKGGKGAGSPKECIVGINVDFFAAFLAGERRYGHDLVYLVPEQRFYFLDPLFQQYVPTSEEKLRLGLSQTLQQRAWGLELDQATLILNQFRSKQVFDEILGKAKALLATDRGFFDGPQGKTRFIQKDQVADNIATKVREFIESEIAVDESSILTIKECLPALDSYLQKSGISRPVHKEIKLVVQSKIREIHKRGLRNDLILPDSRCVAGWRGLRLGQAIGNESEICKSGKSD